MDILFPPDIYAICNEYLIGNFSKWSAKELSIYLNNKFDFDSIVIKEISMVGIKISNVNLSGINLIDVNMSEANLERTILTGANLERTNLTGANL
jgi:uncharacterized protein YjbI with pentapeptide repeats